MSGSPNRRADDSPHPDVEVRRHWIATLARATGEELAACLAALRAPPDFRFTRQPEVGLCQLRGRIGGNGDAFNIGEASITRCAVVLEERTEGIAYILGRDLQRAERAAVLDACLQAGYLAPDIVAPIARRLARERALRQHRTDGTRVEFFTLVRGESPS